MDNTLEKNLELRKALAEVDRLTSENLDLKQQNHVWESEWQELYADNDLLEKMKLRVANAKIPSSIKEYTDTEKELRQFDNLDKTTYPSDPKVRETLFQDILPRLQKKDVKKIVKAEKPKPNGVDPDPPTNIVPFPFDQANEKPWYESMNNKETVEEYLARKEIEFQKSGAELEALRYGIGTLFRKKI